jgi:uncharacterized protein (TIGR02145 family)
MAKSIACVAFFAILTLGLFSQRQTVELTFTAVNRSAYVRLDSIMIMHPSQPGMATTIYWPDTVFSLEVIPGYWALCVGYATISTLGIPEMNDDNSPFTVYQNFPNPMEDRSEISVYVPHTGMVQVWVTDLQGRVVLRTDRQLAGGHHSFRFTAGGGHVYFLTARWNGISRSIKMISTGMQDGKECQLDYLGSRPGEPVLKNSLPANDLIFRQSGILDYPDEDTIYTFQFATNIPCAGTPTVEYEGQVYNTIQVFSQCWLKENLNVGIMIPDTIGPLNNGIIEKYCRSNNPDSCAKYGGLYLWDETMQYIAQEGARGICPPGWHVPADEEWCILAGAVDSQYGIGASMWWESSWRGYDAGKNLKTTSGWHYNGNGTDRFGFSALPDDGSNSAKWWSSTEYYDRAWGHLISWERSEVYRWDVPKEFGLSSVRCLRDN